MDSLVIRNMATQKLPSASEPVTNLVLVGHSGSGKSATGNTLLGQKVFKSKKQAGGVTMKCAMHKAATSDGPVINVIDTPGLFNFSVSADYSSKEIISCLTMVKEGIHAVLLVLSVKNRFSEEEKSTLNTLQSIFERKITDYVIVVFTGGDELEDDGQTLDEYLGQGCPEFLTRILKLCGGRKILLDNMTTNEDKKAKQLKHLFVHIADVARQTGGKPYTHNMHRKRKMHDSEQPTVSEVDRNIVLENVEPPSVLDIHKNMFLVNTQQPSTSETHKNIDLLDMELASASKAGKNIGLQDVEWPSASKASKNMGLVNMGLPSTSETQKNKILLNTAQPSASETHETIVLVNTEQHSESERHKNNGLGNTKQPLVSKTDKIIGLVNTKWLCESNAGKNTGLVNMERHWESNAGKYTGLVNTKQPWESKAGTNIDAVNTEQPWELKADTNIGLVSTEKPWESKAGTSIGLMNTDQPLESKACTNIGSVNNEQPWESKAGTNIDVVNTEQPWELKAGTNIGLVSMEQPWESKACTNIGLVSTDPPESKADTHIGLVSMEQLWESNIGLVSTEEPSASKAGKNIGLVKTKHPSESKAGLDISVVNMEQPWESKTGTNKGVVNTEQPSVSKTGKNKGLMNMKQPLTEADKNIGLADMRLSSASEAVKNIVLVGRTGNGKSATGNSLVGREVFISETRATGVSMSCQAYNTVTANGSWINVIDTPGLFDLSVSAEYLSKEIINCLKLAEGGLHVVVLVLSVRTRFTQEEVNTLSTLQVLFGNEILDYLLVLFTGGDELEADNQTLDDYLLQGCPEFLKKVLSVCGDRRVMFDNKTRDEDKKAEQVRQFLYLVSKIEEQTNGKPFRGKMQCEIKEETERLRQQQKAMEATNLGEAELAEKKRQLQRSNEKKITELENMVKTTLKETNEKIVLMMNENLEKVHTEALNLRKEHASEENMRMVCFPLRHFGAESAGLCTIL